MWRQHSGMIAWPTIFLIFGVVLAWSTAVIAHAAEILSTPSAALLSFGACYLALTPAHEAAHGNITGKRYIWIDGAVGWIAMFILLGPFTPFRELHLRHHTHTNHPDKDPDMWIAGRRLGLLFRFLTILPRYYWCYSFPPHGVRSKLAQTRLHAVGFFLAYSLLVAAMLMAGLLFTVIFVMIIPAWLALSVLAVVFDWLPHHPHRTKERYRNARVIPSEVLDKLLLGQNFHLVHHVWPSVPWYRYGPLFRSQEAHLRSKGAIVVERMADI